MKLTKAEKAICDKYSRYWQDLRVHCFECPLVISVRDCECYATIDGRTKEAKELPRFKEDNE